MSLVVQNTPVSRDQRVPNFGTHASATAAAPKNAPQDPYLDLLKRCLIASIYEESAWRTVTGRGKSYRLFGALRRYIVKYLARHGYLVVKTACFDADTRENGTDWPLFGYSMAGLRRMNNIEMCMRQVIEDEVPGDFVETGVWRGGSTILMRAVLKRLGITDRIVWAADSFEGLPKPTAELDRSDPRYDLSDSTYLKVSLEEVRSNFARFDLLDDQVRFLKGWFKDTLPIAPIERVAVLRLDGDLYESTMDALNGLYHRVSPGGFVIVDDYWSWPTCRAAVDEFRAKHNDTAELQPIDDMAVYWRVRS